MDEEAAKVADDSLVRCPSGLVVRVRKVKVAQLKLLSDRRSVTSGAVYEEFLRYGASEVVDRGPYPDSAEFDWRRALLGDRFRALIGVRVATHGHDFSFDAKCSECGEPIKWTLDLRELVSRDYPKATIDAWLARKPLETTLGGRRVTYAPMTGEEEQRVRGALEKLKNGTAGRPRQAGDQMTDTLFVRLNVEGVDKRDLRDWLDDVDGDELARMQDVMDRQSGGVETRIYVECGELNCGAKVLVEIPFGAGNYWLPRAPTS